MEISKGKISLFTSLKRKKTRVEKKLFLVEGDKCVLDFLPYFRLDSLVALPEWIERNKERISSHTDQVFTADMNQLAKISALSTPADVIGIFRMKEERSDRIPEFGKEELVLLLDDIQDPGNLGTIIRTADWFGIRDIVASRNTVDIYNSKTVQATMGSLGRVNVTYRDLEEVIGRNRHLPVFATLLEGKNIYGLDLPVGAMVVFGNEGNGISDKIKGLVDNALTIPPYSDCHPDSLNVSVAVAVVISRFREKFLKQLG